MKTLGLLGGMSWESTLHYYRRLNQLTRETLGGLHSAPIILHSVDFAEIETLQHQGEWEQLGKILTKHALELEAAGAEGLMICTNTMHKVAPMIQESMSIPLLHIAEKTGRTLVEQDVSKVGLLGTAFTMEQTFYTGHLSKYFDLEVIIPTESERNDVHNIIYQELCHGKIVDNSRDRYLEIVENLKAGGCQGVILGCTEIGLLIDQSMTDLPLFDTTELHCHFGIEWATSD